MFIRGRVGQRWFGGRALGNWRPGNRRGLQRLYRAVRQCRRRQRRRVRYGGAAMRSSAYIKVVSILVAPAGPTHRPSDALNCVRRCCPAGPPPELAIRSISELGDCVVLVKRLRLPKAPDACCSPASSSSDGGSTSRTPGRDTQRIQWDASARAAHARKSETRGSAQEARWPGVAPDDPTRSRLCSPQLAMALALYCTTKILSPP
jgi:hypothetical protein